MKGTYTALVTPFSDGGVDTKKLCELIDFQYKNGVDGVVLLGTTGESPTVSEMEADEIIYEGLKAAEGKIDVVIGCSSNSTAEALKKCRRATSLGAEKLLVLTPYYNKTNKEGMRRHFLTVAEGAGTKIIIYNVPSRTGCSVDAETLTELSAHENIIGIKEASGNVSYAVSISPLISDSFFYDERLRRSDGSPYGNRRVRGDIRRVEYSACKGQRYDRRFSFGRCAKGEKDTDRPSAAYIRAFFGSQSDTSQNGDEHYENECRRISVAALQDVGGKKKNT